MENNLKKSTPKKKTAAKKVAVLPKPDFAKAVQVEKLDNKTLDVVADLLSDDAAKRERARASAKALVPADRKKKADFSMMDSINAKAETVTSQVMAAAVKGKTIRQTAAAKPPASTDLAIHVNKTGRVCFGKLAAQRLGDVRHMLILVEGKTLKLEPSAKATESTVEIRDPGKRPYISATKALKQLGFDGSKPLDLVAQPHGNAGFILKVG